MDDSARLVYERCLDNGWMPWNEVWWNGVGIAAAILLLIFLSVVTTLLIVDWRRRG